jgi:enoyl-CoA hydratase/carnithine racemase
MTAHHIRFETGEDGIAVLTIDRAAKRNAMSWAMLGAFNAAIDQASQDAAIRVLIVTGVAGAFCAGTDLSDLQDNPVAGRPRDETRDTPWWPLTACPKPVIAAIDGYAVGMGAELASQCDVRLVSPNAKFAWNFGHRGLVPDTGAGSWLLPRILGPSRALHLLYSGEVIDADEALRLGFANELHASDQLLDAAMALARRYLAASPVSLSRMKQLVWQGMERDVAAHMKAHANALAECVKSNDHKEGVAAFLEKRAPNFTGT